MKQWVSNLWSLWYCHELLPTRGDTVAVAASGGKDSTVLAYVMKLLNDRHDYGLKLFLLSVDEGITGYRDDSLESVRRNQEEFGLPLKVVSYKELYGWTMDANAASKITTAEEKDLWVSDIAHVLQIVLGR